MRHLRRLKTLRGEQVSSDGKGIRGSSRRPRRFNPQRFLRNLQRHAFEVALTLVFISWLSKAVWHETGIEHLLAPVFAGEQEMNTTTIFDTALQPWRVSVTDRDGVEHAAEVKAASLYEAVALGLRAIKRSSWAGEIPEGITQVKARDLQGPVEHTVKMQVFKKWLARDGGSPSDRATRARVRDILR